MYATYEDAVAAGQEFAIKEQRENFPEFVGQPISPMTSVKYPEPVFQTHDDRVFCVVGELQDYFAAPGPLVMMVIIHQTPEGYDVYWPVP